MASALKDDLFGIRLDTPGSRRGNFKEILSEVRWELNLKGYSHVKLFATGGLDEYSIMDLNPVCDAYGVGTSISSAVTVDFSFDLIEIEGEPVGKRGKKSGRKDLFRCEKCGSSIVTSFGQRPEMCACGSRLTPILKTFNPKEDVVKLPSPREIRARLMSQLSRFGPEDLR